MVLSSRPRMIAVLAGATASGKSDIALEFASKRSDIEIVSADSIQVYQSFDIGSAKPTREERALIPHHLIDLRAPSEPYTAGDFVKEADLAIESILKKGKKPLVVGGTGFYLKALIFGLWDAPSTDPQLRAELESHSLETLVQELEEKDPAIFLKISKKDRYRVIRALEILRRGDGSLPSKLAPKPESHGKKSSEFSIFFLDREDAELSDRIQKRTLQMIEKGLLQETENLLALYPEARALASVGYAQTLRYINGEKPKGRKPTPGLPGLCEEIALATRQLVKQQRTFFFGKNQFGEEGVRKIILNRDRDDLFLELGRIYS